VVACPRLPRLTAAAAVASAGNQWRECTPGCESRGAGRTCWSRLGRECSARCHATRRRHIWESGADGVFSISEDTDGEPLGRGTLIKIYLKVRRRRRPVADDGPLDTSAAAPTRSHKVWHVVQGSAAGCQLGSRRRSHVSHCVPQRVPLVTWSGGGKSALG